MKHQHQAGQWEVQFQNLPCYEPKSTMSENLHRIWLAPKDSFTYQIRETKYYYSDNIAAAQVEDKRKLRKPHALFQLWPAPSHVEYCIRLGVAVNWIWKPR